MKIKYVLISTIMLITLGATVFGQTKQKTTTKTAIKQKDVSSVLGKPIFESIVDSLNTKVWIITQKKYKGMMQTKMGKMMGKMKADNKTMDKTTKNAILTGTHYFILDVTNIRDNKEFADSSAKVEIVSPAKKIASLKLQPMMNHFGGGVTFDEKGEYLFTINLNIGMGYKTSQFKYKIK
ncbi:MAG: hypothetical protein CVV24_14225 [Ignavibacteriae bacterium HGW-Ignavibacteriae-3]|nr:MAG: hypothetical protein CVV24_14225 [Ignavibacteriae bacterium HGW-Ignavibacteriae-3]